MINKILPHQAPVPIASWKPQILDAFGYGNSCIQQSNAIGNSGPESEDCLYLNVFVPGISYRIFEYFPFCTLQMKCNHIFSECKTT